MRGERERRRGINNWEERGIIEKRGVNWEERGIIERREEKLRWRYLQDFLEILERMPENQKCQNTRKPWRTVSFVTTCTEICSAYSNLQPHNSVWLPLAKELINNTHIKKVKVNRILLDMTLIDYCNMSPTLLVEEIKIWDKVTFSLFNSLYIFMFIELLSSLAWV